MRVLMTADPIGGVWNYALELCGALAKQGVQVCLATLGAEPSGVQQSQLDRLRNVVCIPSAYRLEWMSDAWSDLARAAEWLLDVEHVLRPDIVHLNHLVHADLPWQAPVLVTGHSCVLSWWCAVRGGEPPPQWNTYRQRVRQSLQSANWVTAPTRAMLFELNARYGPLRNTAVVYNARDQRMFSPGRKERFVLSAGRVWDEAKNIAALATVAQSVSAPVVVAGPVTGPEGGTAVAPGVWLLGNLDPPELASWYSRAAIYALPARYEPFGLTVLEAALSGCALVLGDIESLREIWGPAARYVDPEDTDALRDTLNELLADDFLRSNLAARAMARARQFSPEALGNNYLTLYRSAERGAPRAARAASARLN